ncbi:hypothetical protein HF072_13935 [Bacillus sp. RO3]|nr:hypothetical protein [Bacillus sp. RO3]
MIYLFSLLALILLLPILYFIPIGISVKGKALIAGVSFGLTLLGLAASSLYPTWLIAVMLLIMLAIFSYMIEQRFSGVLAASGAAEMTMQEHVEPKKEESLFPPMQMVVEKETVEESRGTGDEESLPPQIAIDVQDTYKEDFLLEEEPHSYISDEAVEEQRTDESEGEVMVVNEAEDTMEAVVDESEWFIENVIEYDLHEETAGEDDDRSAAVHFSEIELPEEHTEAEVAFVLDEKESKVEIDGKAKDMEEIEEVEAEKDIEELEDFNEVEAEKDIEELQDFKEIEPVKDIEELEDTEAIREMEASSQSDADKEREEGSDLEEGMIQDDDEVEDSHVEENISSVADHDKEENHSTIHSYQQPRIMREVMKTMIDQINLSKGLLSSHQFENMLKHYLNPSLHDQDYYTFARILMDHYISEEQYEDLQMLINGIEERFKEYPFIRMDIEQTNEFAWSNYTKLK